LISSSSIAGSIAIVHLPPRLFYQAYELPPFVFRGKFKECLRTSVHELDPEVTAPPNTAILVIEALQYMRRRRKASLMAGEPRPIPGACGKIDYSLFSRRVDVLDALGTDLYDARSASSDLNNIAAGPEQPLKQFFSLLHRKPKRTTA
jgi:hypothetical protein